MEYSAREIEVLDGVEVVRRRPFLFLEEPTVPGVSMHGRPSRTFGGGILNALSERLVVSTVHDDIRYRCAFARGGLVAFLTRARTDERCGTNWFTLRPDPIVLRGDLAFDDVAAIAAQCPSAAPIEVIDRRSERALWW